MKELIDRQEVIKNIGDCLDMNGYVDTTKFAKCMRKILNMPYETETIIRAAERKKFAEEIKQEFEYAYHANVSKKRLRRILLDMLERRRNDNF